MPVTSTTVLASGNDGTPNYPYKRYGRTIIRETPLELFLTYL